MWCDHCQQEVPGIASPGEDESIVCARCGDALTAGATARAVEATSKTMPLSEAAKSFEEKLQSLLAAEDWQLEDWQLDDHLADARLMVSLARQQEQEAETYDDDEPTEFFREQRTDARHTAPRSQRRQHREPPRKRPASFMAWAFLSLGLMALVCGGVLLGWSYAAGRGELWTLGLPMLFAGQAGLLLGLMFQLLSMWRHHRATAASLEDLDEEVSELRSSAAPVHSLHARGGRIHGAHRAAGDSPQMLLADLQRQMDRLAARLERQR